jgi:hypothetical protein
VSGKVDLRKLEPIRKSVASVTLSQNDVGETVLDVSYGMATLTVVVDRVDLNDLRALMARPPGPGPKRHAAPEVKP